MGPLAHAVSPLPFFAYFPKPQPVADYPFLLIGLSKSGSSKQPIWNYSAKSARRVLWNQ
jgi:hypothetical protein